MCGFHLDYHYKVMYHEQRIELIAKSLYCPLPRHTHFAYSHVAVASCLRFNFPWPTGKLMRIYIQQSGSIRSTSYSKVRIAVDSPADHYGLSESNSQNPFLLASHVRTTPRMSPSVHFISPIIIRTAKSKSHVAVL